MNEYWDERYDMAYYVYVSYFVRVVGANTQSMIDIGSNGAPYVTWFPWIESVTSLDLKRPYVGEGVTSITADFMEWQPDRTYDLALCLQVLEHLTQPDVFLQKIFSIARHAIVSVPFEWPAGSSEEHIQDPVDLEKVISWAGRPPNYHLVVAEPFVDRLMPKARRLIAYFDVAKPRRLVSGAEVKARRPRAGQP